MNKRSLQILIAVAAVVAIAVLVFLFRKRLGFVKAEKFQNIDCPSYGLQWSQKVENGRPVFLAYNPETKRNDIELFLTPINDLSKNHFAQVISDCFKANRYSQCDIIRKPVYSSDIVFDDKAVHLMFNPLSASNLIGLVVDTRNPTKSGIKNIDLYNKFYGNCIVNKIRNKALMSSKE
jgi:hypothetical protein